MKLAAALVALAGCAQVFGLKEGPEVDALQPAGEACATGDGRHDEDCDGIADDDDNCPNLPNQDQADGDTDKVGDLCDPNPDDSTNTRLAFAPFTDAEMPEWAAFGGNWAIHDDAMFSSDTADDTEGGTFFIAKSNVSAGLVLDARIVVDDIGTAPDTAYEMALLALGTDGSHQGVSCEHDRKKNGAGEQADIVEVFLPNSGSTQTTSANSKLAAGAQYRARLTVSDDNQVTCQWDGPDGDSATAQLQSPSVLADGLIGLMTKRTAVHVLSLDIVRLAPTAVR